MSSDLSQVFPSWTVRPIKVTKAYLITRSLAVKSCTGWHPDKIPIALNFGCPGFHHRVSSLRNSTTGIDNSDKVTIERVSGPKRVARLDYWPVWPTYSSIESEVERWVWASRMRPLGQAGRCQVDRIYFPERIAKFAPGSEICNPVHAKSLGQNSLAGVDLNSLSLSSHT